MKTRTDEVQRYEAALRRIVYQAKSWKRRMEHWEETGRGVTDTHRAILRAYVGNAAKLRRRSACRGGNFSGASARMRDRGSSMNVSRVPPLCGYVGYHKHTNQLPFS